MKITILLTVHLWKSVKLKMETDKDVWISPLVKSWRRFKLVYRFYMDWWSLIGVIIWSKWPKIDLSAGQISPCSLADLTRKNCNSMETHQWLFYKPQSISPYRRQKILFGFFWVNVVKCWKMPFFGVIWVQIVK